MDFAFLIVVINKLSQISATAVAKLPVQSLKEDVIPA